MENSEAEKDWNAEVTSILANIYRCPEKKNWYSQVAAAYDRTRPRYPAILLNRVLKLAQFQPKANILEIGCGPGIATTEFAKFGLSMVCLEPSQSACELARSNCADYADVEIINTTFEEWDLETKKFDAILAATSFHWVEPKIRYQKTAAALKDEGWLILLWNTPPQPSYEIHQMLAEVYQAYAPSLAKYEQSETYQKNLSHIGQAVIDSGYFEDLVAEEFVCDLTYSVDDYLALLSTLSPYIRLEPNQRDSLFVGLKKVLHNNCGDLLNLSYLSVFQIAQKITDNRPPAKVLN
jgi:SAM-dependent methyltransferase